MEQIADGVYQIPVLGAQVWLLAEEPLTLIDTGWPGSGRTVLRALARLAKRPDELRYVVLTHYHPDHLGALPELLARCQHLQVAIHAAEAPYLANPAALPNPVAPNARLLRALVGAAWPLVRLRRPCPVRTPLHDGDPLPSRADSRLLHLPGHTPGSSAVYLPEQGLVLAGDAFERRGGRLGPPGRPFTADMAVAWASIARLAALDFDTLALSHWRPVRHGAAAQVRALAARRKQ